MNLHIPDVRILEVHPAPWSNLRSRCQPSSILEERNDLGLPLLLHAVADAANLGYNFLNVSGEEPLRYPWLAALCREAHKHGMLTSMISRSMALTAPQLEWLRFSIDLLGVEMEGKDAAPQPAGTLAARRTDHGAAPGRGPRLGDSLRYRLLPDLRQPARNWNGRRSSPRHRAPPCCRCGRRRNSPTNRWRRPG